MSFAEIIEELPALTPEQRDEIADRALDLNEVDLSPEQRSELDRRLAGLDADPSIAVPYEGTKEAVLRRLEDLHAAQTASH